MLCCEEEPYLLHGPTTGWKKIKNGKDQAVRNLTDETCGDPNCFCCCEDLACPSQQSESTEKCEERSQDIDKYCKEMDSCLVNEMVHSLKRDQVKKTNSDEMLNKKGISDYVMDMTFITRVRQQFYDHKDPPKNKNFQFAVFKFGPANDDWDPSIDDAGLEWSSSLVVQDFLQNTWQASSFAACKDGCHTEAVIINDQSISGLHHMFTRECDQQPPHVFNIYSYNSPCIRFWHWLSKSHSRHPNKLFRRSLEGALQSTRMANKHRMDITIP